MMGQAAGYVCGDDAVMAAALAFNVTVRPSVVSAFSWGLTPHASGAAVKQCSISTFVCAAPKPVAFLSGACDSSALRGVGEVERAEVVGPVLVVVFGAFALRLVVATLRGV